MRFFVFVFILFPTLLTGQQFININSYYLETFYDSGVDWGDYDDDGDLDLIMIGGNGGTQGKSRIYTNSYSKSNFPTWHFEKIIDPSTSNYQSAEVSWGDYDNDGDLDFVAVGSIVSCPNSPLVRNDKINYNSSLRNFIPSFTGLQKLNQGSIDWGDYDNDGDLDMIVLGSDGAVAHTIIYQNNNGVFTNINAGLLNFNRGVVKWVDYDNDKDLDVFISGRYGVVGSLIYQNNNGVFTDINAGLAGITYNDADWGDYDNDGDLDLVMVGDTSYGFPFAMIYQNNNGIFSGFTSNLKPVRKSSVKWGDYDNDGDLDLILAGDSSFASFGSYFHTDIYQNEGGNVFTPINAGIPGCDYANHKWGDYDNDGDLDLIITGKTKTSTIGAVFSNQLDSSFSNTKPLSPTGLSTIVNNNQVEFIWNKSTDIETPQLGLSYNLYVGSTPNGVEIMSPMADILTGYRKKAALGNTQSNNSWYLKNLPPGQYWWGVQAIDQAFAGSIFSQKETFIIFDSIAPTLHYPYANDINIKNDTSLHWFSYPNAISYQLQLDTSIDFISPIISSLSISDTLLLFNLQLNTKYFWRVKANTLTDTSDWSSVKFFKTKPFFSEVLTSIIPNVRGDANFGDYDNDGDLDLVTTISSGSVVIYRNDSNVFNTASSSMNFANGPNVAWGDYDNDGDLDFAILGYDIYKNNGGVFSKINAGFLVTTSGDLAWGDYDNDGDLDLIQTGSKGGSGLSTRLYQNDNGVFTEIIHTMQKMTHNSRARWGDFDQDGDLDLLLVGQTSNTPYTWAVYRNDNAVFNLQQATADGITYGDGQWGDLDNDGDLDVVVSGESKTYIYINNNGIFNRLNEDLIGLTYVSIDLGDYDNDNDLDILFTGNIYYNSDNYKTTLLYRNNINIPNTKPNAPSNLLAQMNTDSINFSWDAATDNETSSSGLYYNIYLGTAAGLIDSISPMADISSGERRIVAIGNTNSNSSWKIKNLTPGLYYWSVQSIDNNFSASPFAPEQVVSVITDIDDNNQNISTEVYPNPNNGSYVLFYTGTTNKLEIELVNTSGQIINKQLFNNVSGGIAINYNDSKIASGIYFLRIISDKGLSTQKLIIK